MASTSRRVSRSGSPPRACGGLVSKVMNEEISVTISSNKLLPWLFFADDSVPAAPASWGVFLRPINAEKKAVIPMPVYTSGVNVGLTIKLKKHAINELVNSFISRACIRTQCGDAVVHADGTYVRFPHSTHMAWLSVWSLPLYLRDKLAAAAAGRAAEHSVKMDDNLFTLTDFMHRQHVDGEHKIQLTKIQVVGCAAAGNSTNPLA